MKLREKVLLVICVVLGLVVSERSVLANTYYCDPDICKIWNGTDYNFHDHIACGNNGSLSDDCPYGAYMVDLNSRRMNLILDLHNAARNRIAMGKIEGYSPAEEMPVLKWDRELEYTASLNVKTCKFAHDRCRNTYRYKYSGQNIGISTQNPPFHSNSKRIKLTVGRWFYEYPDANQTFIDEYDNHPKGKMIGHFAMMVADRAKRVGCAAIRFWKGEQGLAFLLTCNYDFTPVFTEPIYKSGPSASKCLKVSKRYPGLCEWDEDYEDSEESNELFGNDLEYIPQLL